MNSLYHAAAEFYRDPSQDNRTMWYKHVNTDIAREIIMYGMQWRGWRPDAEVVMQVWDRYGMQDPSVFFCEAVFRHRAVWARIATLLHDAWRWDDLVKAMHCSAWQGHDDDAGYRYLYGLLHGPDDHMGPLLVLCDSFADQLQPAHMVRLIHLMHNGYFVDVMLLLNKLSGKTLAHIVPMLLRMEGVDHLIEMVAFDNLPALKQALEVVPEAQTPVTDLARPLAALTDARLLCMVQCYSFTALSRMEWHTALCERGLPSRGYFTVPDMEPCNVHEAIWSARWLSSVYGTPHIIARALQLHPKACPPCMHEYMERHRERCAATMKRAGKWDIPEVLTTLISTYM